LLRSSVEQPHTVCDVCSVVAVKHTIKKVIVFPVTSWDVTNQTLPGQELLNYSRPGRVWLVTSRLGTGKTTTFFTVHFFLKVVLPHFVKPLLLVSYSPCSMVVMLQFCRFSSLTGLNLSGEKTSWLRILKKTVHNV